MSKLAVVTIDGPAGVGKTTISRMVAQHLNYTCLDTGAMYRTFAWMLHHIGHTAEELEKDEGLQSMLGQLELKLLPPREGEENGRVQVGGLELGPELRTEEISCLASEIASLPPIRKVLTAMQQQMGKAGGVVIEGRDTGTVVFPDAAWKFYLDADPRVRVQRRVAQMRARGEVGVNEAELLQSLMARDEQDSHRAIAPLKKADDACVIDTTNLSIREVVGEMLVHIQVNPI